MKNFATPHCHPQSLDSASTPEAFLKRELELETGAITVTDHGTMAACRKVYDLAQSKKITPILGLEGYFRDDDCPILKAAGITDSKAYNKYYHLTFHALDQEGYHFLAKKLSEAPVERHGHEVKPLFNWKDLEEIGQYNVTISAGCLIGMVQRHLLAHGDAALAEKYYQALRNLVRPGNFYVEIFPHCCDRNWVQGVFLELENGETIRYHDKKKLKCDSCGEIEAADLALKALKNPAFTPGKLLSVMNMRKWTDQAPTNIISVKRIEDFIENECQPWCPDGDVQKGCNLLMLDLAKKYGDPVLISDDSHYAVEDEKIVQDIRLRQSGNWRFYGHYHRQSSKQAFEEYFKPKMGVDEKTFEGWVDNNNAWASRFKGFKFTDTPSLPTKFYPEQTLQHTIQLIRKHGRMDWKNKGYEDRLRAEINLLHYNGSIDLLPYFFIDEDVCSFYEQQGMLTGPGRGSAAGLLLTYLLGITHVDPLKFNLSMERFLTADRIKSGKLPDIDQDLPTRDPLVEDKEVEMKMADGTIQKVIQPSYLKHRFGDHFAQISVDTTLKLKSAVKDVARVIHNGTIPDHIEKLTKKFLMPPQGISDRDFVFGYEANEEHVPGSIETDEALKEYVKYYPQEWAIVQKCLGLARQKSRHACAYVIANKPIREFIPLTTISGVTVTQYTAPSVEACGGLKMDFLVINSLNDIQDCIKLIQQRSGLQGEPGDPTKAGLFRGDMTINGKRVPAIRQVPIVARDSHPNENLRHEIVDIWDLPEDQAVFRDVAEGKTPTVFQFNTPGAVQWLREFNHWKDQKEGRKAIDSIEAMAAFTALDRPGPLDAYVEDPSNGEKHNMLVEYARRARGEPPIGTLPIFEEVLPETYGVMVFQEQLQKMYQVLTGCSGPEAEEFRTNVAKKKMEKVLKAQPLFVERASAKMTKEEAQGVFDFFVSWGQYGFNKSHAVCYSVIGYACAYLKHHFPLEWWCAVLRNATRNEINETFWRHCGHLIDLPDIKISGPNFEIIGDRIRAPASLLHGVGETAQAQLAKYGPYSSLDDFCQKIVTVGEVGKTPVMKKDAEGKVTTEQDRDKKGNLKWRKGNNALKRNVVHKLIVSEAMDSLFPDKLVDSIGQELPVTIYDKLEMYEAALAKAQGKSKPPKNAIPFVLKTLNTYQRYQMKKEILPAYSQSLVRTFVETQVPGVRLPKGKLPVFQYGRTEIPFVSPKMLDRLEMTTPWPDDTNIWVALGAYIVDQRTFNYGDSKEKEACELQLDVEGARYKVVKWPDRKTNEIPEKFKANLKGAVVIALFSKYREDRPFNIEEMFIVQRPLGEEPPEPEQSPEESA